MSQPIASYAFIQGSEPRVFHSAEDLKKELEEELEFWKWLDGKTCPKGEGYLQVVRAALERLKASYTSPDALRKEGKFQEFIGNIGRYYQHGKGLHRSHIRAGWIESLRRLRSEQVAVAALELVLAPEEASAVKAEALTAISLYELGFTPEQPAVERIWKTMRAEHEALYAQYDKRLYELRERYERLIPIEAPVKLWTAVRDEMNSAVTRYLWLLAGASFLGVVGLALLIGHLFGAFGLDAAYAPEQYGEQGIVRFWAPAVVVLAVSFVVWMLRMIAKLFFSAVHLRLDARERMALATTYLSLNETRNVVDAQGMTIVLNALFRPATTGVIKDPPEFGVMDLIARRFSG